jgi:siroheme synthase-like protein
VSGFPILVHGGAVAAVVVGGGAVAARKVTELVACGARVRVIAPRFAPQLRELAAAEPRLALVERAFEAGDVADAELVFAATDSPAVNAAVADEARELHRLVSVADAPALGSFGGMAAHRDGELVVGVSAGGVPSAAVRIRDEIAARLGPPFADAVAALGGLRQRLLAAGARERWREAAAALVDERFCDDVRGGTFFARIGQWR